MMVAGGSGRLPAAEGAIVDYLHTCLSLHGDLSEKLFGRRQNLEEVEAKAQQVRSSGRLTYDDIEVIRNEEHWSGGQFWHWPSREEIGEELEKMPWEWGKLHKKEKEKATIKRLLALFRNIEPVSVVLRFIDPREYGILSPPVEKALELSPTSSPLDKYLDYLQNLRYVRDNRALGTAASVDMALWVLQLGVIEQRLDGWEPLFEEFRADRRLAAIRVRNLTESLFETMSRSDLAEALLPTNRELSSEIAALEFERAVRTLTRASNENTLRDLVQQFYRSGNLSRDERLRWTNAVKLRNRAVHKSPPLGQGMAEELVQVMREAVDQNKG